MKPSEQDRLLRAILADEEVERLRADSLAGGLTAARHRRRRRTLVSSLATALALTMTGVIVIHRAPHGDVTADALNKTPVKPTSVKIISDEQLLALFPERSLALIGQPGSQRLVFLDAPTSSLASSEKR